MLLGNALILKSCSIFSPAQPYPLCAPKFNLTQRWRMSAFACEIDVLFLGEGVSAGRYEPLYPYWGSNSGLALSHSAH